MINSIVDYRDSISRNAEKCFNIVSGIFADRDDCILTLCQATRDQPPVDHSLPVIFLGNSEGSKVVYGRHHGARLAP